MRKATIALLTAILTVYFINIGQSQRSYDPKSVEVTRWLDPTTSPITYNEYNSSHQFAEAGNFQLLRSPAATTDIMIDIIVNQNLYPYIEDVLDTFLFDLSLDGYGVNLYTGLPTISPTETRTLLSDDWQMYEIEGVILIGDLAVPWYEMDEPPDWGGAYVQFPIDLYFMDLDGIWIDSDNNGLFDDHGGATMLADIWCGRLITSNLSYHGVTEVSALRNYFAKNHAYRAGELRLNDRALAFIDNDWHTYNWEMDVSRAYPFTDPVTDIYETCRDNYINMVREATDNQYEHVLICSHSSPTSHYLFYDMDNYQQFYNYEIDDYDMQALGFNLFACSNARYVENNNMGAWYIFQNDYGLISVGSSKTGSMLCFDDFYQALAAEASYGQAFLTWAQMDIETCADDISRPWFYGMCLQGDPTIRLSRYQPPLEYCNYTPGDINGDGTVIGSDVTYGVQYFRGVGLPPPDSCWDILTSNWIYVSADVNGSCNFLGSDITYLVRYFRGEHDSLLHCPRFPEP